MDKYELVKREVVPTGGFGDGCEGESAPIKITSHGKMSTYITLATEKLTSDDHGARKARVRLEGVGKAISKLISVVEVVKRTVAQPVVRRPDRAHAPSSLPVRSRDQVTNAITILQHQLTELGTIKNVETYEPLEHGLKTVVHEKFNSAIAVTLSLDAGELDRNHVGYQAPDVAS